MTRSLIIGASGGIGAAMTRALTARGDDVTTLSRSADGLDLTDEASIELRASVVSQFGQHSILVPGFFV